MSRTRLSLLKAHSGLIAYTQEKPSSSLSLSTGQPSKEQTQDSTPLLYHIPVLDAPPGLFFGGHKEISLAVMFGSSPMGGSVVPNEKMVIPIPSAPSSDTDDRLPLMPVDKEDFALDLGAVLGAVFLRICGKTRFFWKISEE